MEPSSAALAQPKAWACCLPSYNTVITRKRTIKTPEEILSVLYGFFSTTWVSLQSRVLAECRSGNPAQRLWTSLFIGHLCSFQTPLSSPPYSSDSTKLSHQPAEVLLILLRMLSVSGRPAGDFPAASSLRDPCCTPAFSSLCLSSAAQRLLTELELTLQMASPCGKRLFRPHKGRKLSSCLSFRSTSKTFLGLLLCEKAILATLSLEIQVS